MTDIVFVRTRYQYDSYTDYWSLVDLAGFPTCFTDEVDLARNVAYVISPINGEWRPHIDHCRKTGQAQDCLLVQWNLERPEGSGSLEHYYESNRQAIEEGYWDEVWVSDRTLAERTGFRHAVLGSDDRLGTPGHHDTWDAIHLSCPSHRRERVWSEMSRAGLAVAVNGWGHERHLRLQGSRFMLNVHKEADGNYVEPLRFALAAAYALPVLTETLADPHPYRGVEQAPYDRLVPRLREMLREDYAGWKERGRILWETLTGEHSFRQEVEAMFR